MMMMEHRSLIISRKQCHQTDKISIMCAIWPFDQLQAMLFGYFLGASGVSQ